MYILFKFLPFIIAPFLFPGLSGGIRFTAFLILAVFCIVRYYLEKRLYPSQTVSTCFSPFHIVITAGILFLFFQIGDAWPKHSLWTGVVSGALIFLSMAGLKPPILPGIGLSALLMWIILSFKDIFSSIFPHSNFPAIVARFFPPASMAIHTQVEIGQAIISPVDHTPAYLLHMALIITAACVFGFCFHPLVQSSRYRTYLIYLILVIVSFGLIIILGNLGFVIVGINLFVFLLFNGEFRKKSRKVSIFTGIAIITILGGLGYLSFVEFFLGQTASLAGFSIKPLVQFNWMETHPFVPYDSETGFNLIHWLITGIIAVGILLLVFENKANIRHKHTFYPLIISNVLIILLYSFPSSLIFLSNPLVWILTGSLQTSAAENNQGEYNTDYSKQKYVLLPMLGCIGLILFLIASLHFYREWRGDHQLQTYVSSRNQKERIEAAYDGFRQSPYRGDLAALYATTLLQTLSYPPVLPESSELEELDRALHVSAKNGYITTLAYKRLSDLYFVHSNTERSIQVLNIAAERFPNQKVLHELLGDRLNILGRREEAMQQYRISVNLDPASLQLREKLVSIYKLLGKMDDYQRERLQILKLDPAHEIN